MKIKYLEPTKDQSHLLNVELGHHYCDESRKFKEGDDPDKIGTWFTVNGWEGDIAMGIRLTLEPFINKYLQHLNEAIPISKIIEDEYKAKGKNFNHFINDVYLLSKGPDILRDSISDYSIVKQDDIELSLKDILAYYYF